MRRTLTAVLAAVLAAATLAASHEDDYDWESAHGLSEPVYDEWFVEEYRIPTDHGTIYGVVERPVVPDDVDVPVILTYTPYRVLGQPVSQAEGRVGHLDPTASYYVPRGYARAIFDLVGTRESGGCTDFGGIRERETGAAVVDFLGDQPWSNGRVGMVGASYDGTTAISAAIEAPEHLVTIVPQVAIDRWWDYAYVGGVRRYSGYGTPLLFDFGFGLVPPTNVNDPVGAAGTTVDHANPCDRAENTERGYGYDPVYDDYFDERDYRALAADVKASVLVEAGWLDRNVRPVGGVGFWMALPDDHPKKLVAGQWAHATPRLVDWQDVRHAWFDHWLLGLDTGVMELPRVDSEDNTRWRYQHDHWPPLGTEVVEVPLGGDAEVPGAPVTFDLDELTWDSHTTCQSAFVADCPVVLSTPAEEDVRFSGTIELDVTVSTVNRFDAQGRVATQVVVQLLDVDAGGRSTVIGQSMLNSRNRESLRESTMHDSGTPWSGTLEFDPIDHTLRAGHQLALVVASHIENVSVVPDNDAPVVNTLLGAASALRLPVGPLA